MIISRDAEKAFDKIQHPFIIKILQKAGIEGTYLNILKAIYDKPQWWKIESISPQVKGAHSHHCYSTVLEVLATAIRE